MGRVLFVLGMLAAIASAGGAETGRTRTEVKGLRLTLPSAWARTPASSDVRAAQYRIPPEGNDSRAVEFVVFHFGRGKGGSAEENLTRWYDQFVQPDGSPSRDAGVVTTRTVKGLRVTVLDLAGTYRGMAPGGEPPQQDSRLLAAIVEGGEGPWFLRMVGPATTVGHAKPAFDALILSLEPH